MNAFLHIYLYNLHIRCTGGTELSISVVVIEDNKNVRELLVERLNAEGDIQVIGCYDNGVAGMSAILAYRPNVVLVDLMIPGKDGIAIMEELNALGLMNNPVCCLVLTAVISDEITQKAFSLGAKYVMIKPYDLSAVVRRVKDVLLEEPRNKNNKAANLERKVTNILSDTGILPNLKGYKYLKQAVILGYDDSSILEGITKKLYPKIAVQNDTSSSKVERAIRHSIESAWGKYDGNGFYARIGFAKPKDGKKPTNSEFISAIVEYLRLNL